MPPPFRSRTRNHFGLSFEAIEPFSMCSPKNQRAGMMIRFSSLLSLLVLLTSHAQRAGCDMKDAECLDENQVFVQLRSEVRDSKDSDLSVAAHPRWRRRWRRRNQRYHAYGPSSTTSITTLRSPDPAPGGQTPTTATTTTTTTSTTTTTTSTTTIPVCTASDDDGDGKRDAKAVNETDIDIPRDANTTVLLVVDAEEAAGCCVENSLSSVGVIVLFQTGSGSLTLSLETPNMQSQELGVTNSAFFPFSDTIFPGAPVAGVWKLIFKAGPDAAGWRATFSQVAFFVDQCV